MVKLLHEAGIEVLLDVVFNHSGEGGFFGPVVGFRGLDAGYYVADSADLTRYVDTTGCGNSMNMRNPYMLQLVMDSLRYWVTEMHVDGFRFDLAVTLARDIGQGPDRLSAFFDLVQQDPIVSRVKLIAEPWDIGWGGYQVGNFPPQWAEWNGKFRDCVRDYWRGQEGVLPELATRLSGSADLYADDGRRPFASVNFITAHDGFSLADLVSYDSKHNEANLEANHDGANDNRSWNCGVEGPTDDPAVLALRARQQRNFLVTLILAQGAPMLLGGDEMGRTQQGNNNAYCQDSPISWFDWSRCDQGLLDVTRTLIQLRRDNPVLQRRHWLSGRPENGSPTPDVAWFHPAGNPMTDQDWGTTWNRAIGVYLNGDGITELTARGERKQSDSVFLCLNAYWDDVGFTLPDADFGKRWDVVVDTGAEAGAAPVSVDAGGSITALGRSAIVLRRPRMT
jgi:glycogen operon protein